MPPVPAKTSQPSRPRRRRRALLEKVAVRCLNRRLFAMAWLTFKAAFRYRLVQVLSVLLLVAVLGLPAVIRHDGTAQGFTQILLTYTLGSITVLLGFVTLWLACGTLARDVEECQMQTVAVKPVARWEIWLGKWLGIMVLNLMLLGLAGAAVYGLLEYRARQLPPDLQEELREKILVARGSVKQQLDRTALEAEVERQFQQRMKDPALALRDREVVRTQIREGLKSQLQNVPPNTWRRWVLDLGRGADRLRDRPLFVRAKFLTSEYRPADTYVGVWEIGPTDRPRYRPEPMSLAPDTFHEFPIPPGLIDAAGRLTIDFLNYNDIALLFPLENDLELLYREGGFTLNYLRALAIVACWLALLAAIGLAAASTLSFPVAAFVAAAILIVGFSTGTLRQVITEGGISGVNPNTGAIDVPDVLDRAAVVLFRGVLFVVNLVQDFSPVESLSTGRSVTWAELSLAVLQIVVLMGGAFAALGMIAFNRRELAAAQGA